jgi:Arc/MetJ family transcription regulator
MKTTIDIDEAKLKRLMQVAGLKTRKEAVDYALTEAEHTARLKKLLVRETDYKSAVDPNYDVIALRNRETGRGPSSH